MFRSYFTTAIRNLQRNKIYSVINMAGLSIGLACAMLILLYIKDEVSFDRFHQKAPQIYRVANKGKRNGTESKRSSTGFLQGPRFAENVPGIQAFVRVQSGEEYIKKGSEIRSQYVLRVDPTFFTVFTFPLLEGDPKTCLTDPYSVVLTEDAAKQQFGTTDALGRFLLLKNDSTYRPYKVTAVAKRCPENSSIQFRVLLPLRVFPEEAGNNDNWFSFFLNTFVLLNPNANLQTVERQMQQFYQKDAAATFHKLVEKYNAGPDADMGTYFLQPFTDMHLNTELPAQNGLSNASNPVYAYILSGIALFILLIACINFVNLTVARSVKRAREIGIRKMVGGARKQLIVQFLSESFLLCFLAFALALGIVQLVLPVFNNLANKALALSYLFDAKLIAGYAVLLCLTGLLAGFYPALVLSGYKPVDILYSRFRLSGKNYLQKSLVVLQFALASFLIIATFTLYAQFNFLTKADLGYNDKNLVVLNKYPLTHSDAAAFKTELLKNPNIEAVAPNNVGHSFTGAKLSNDSALSFNYATIDESYFPALHIPIVQGRNFSTDHPSDSNNNILVNEAFVKRAGWKHPIGETVNFFYNNNEIYHVIGVVKDYHYAPLNQTIEPQLFSMKNANNYDMVYVRIRPNSGAESLPYIRSVFQSFFPLDPWSYTFKEDENLGNYAAEAKWKQIMLFSALLTIFISCIGLFGLSVLSAEKRTKEIGIRKVLGASVNSIVTILSKDFLGLVLIALLVAMPLAWMVASNWLENYPYRVGLQWWLFAAAALLVVLIALLTVSLQALKTALSDPVRSLRSE